MYTIPSQRYSTQCSHREAACAGKIPQLSKKAFIHMQNALKLLNNTLALQHYEMRERLVVSYTQKTMSLECKMTSLFDHWPRWFLSWRPSVWGTRWLGLRPPRSWWRPSWQRQRHHRRQSVRPVRPRLETAACSDHTTEHLQRAGQDMLIISWLPILLYYVLAENFDEETNFPPNSKHCSSVPY